MKEQQTFIKIDSIISESIKSKEAMLSNPTIKGQINDCIHQMVSAFRNGNKVLFCGNGGSAADAQHLAAELSGRFYMDRPALPAEALHVNTSYLTAVANDYSFDVVYARLIEGIGHAGDILIGMSTSGKSINICNALQSAKGKGMFTIGLTGIQDDKMGEFCDVLIKVPTNITPRIQECHMLIGHIICEMVEAQYFESPSEV
ncbi:MAG: D-sedoheptulose 7-phosphate isomerase [Saprospiraceae bacterium]